MKSKKVVTTLVITLMTMGLLGSACGKRASRKVKPTVKLSRVQILAQNSEVADLTKELNLKLTELDTAMAELATAKDEAKKMDHDYEKLDDDSRAKAKKGFDDLSEKLLKIEEIKSEISDIMAAINTKEVKDRIVKVQAEETEASVTK